MSEKSSVGQVEKIKKLIKTATNPKQKAMYQDLLRKLETELGSQVDTKSQPEVQEESTNPTQPNSQPAAASHPNRVPSPPKSSSKKSTKTKQAERVSATESKPKSTSKKVKSQTQTSDVDSEKVNQPPLKSESNNPTAEKVQDSTSKLETSSQSVEAKESTPSDSTSQLVDEKVQDSSSKSMEVKESTSSDSTSQTVGEEVQVSEKIAETSQTELELSSDNIQAESEETKDKSSGDDSESSSDDEPENLYYFQGIGIIKGEVTLTEERSIIKIGGKEYRLFYIPNRRKKAYEALKREIDQTQNPTQRLIVYPRILHLPKKDQPHQVSFQVVGFIGSKSKPTQLNEELEDFEFKFSGLWQFIPVCRTPCISIFRNFNKERLAWIKEANPAKKVKFMKASHVPLLWRDSPVKPFRFNPKLEKEQQGQTYFVQIKAKFIPGRDVFGFVEQLEEPTENAPGFLKASKKVKAEALAEVKDRQKQQSSTQSSNPSKEQKPPVQHPKKSEVQPDENSEVQQQNQQETQPPKKPKPKKQKKSQVQQQENSQIQEPSPEQQENYQVPESNPSQVEQQENSQNEQSKPLEIQQPLQSEVEQLNQLELRELQQSTEIEPPEKSEFEQS